LLKGINERKNTLRFDGGRAESGNGVMIHATSNIIPAWVSTMRNLLAAIINDMSELKSHTYRDRYRAAVFMVHIEITNPQ
jgi:hypothetical protein